MSSPSIRGLRNEFLLNSATLLVGVAPSTAAHLASEARDLLLEREQKLPPVMIRGTCTACGTVRLPGLTTSTLRLSRPKRRDQKLSKSVLYECHACGRIRVERLPTSGRVSAHTSKVIQTSQERVPQRLVPRPETEPKRSTSQRVALSSTNSSAGRKRTKPGKQRSLKALLENRKAAQDDRQESSGLSLMDFMHK